MTETYPLHIGSIQNSRDHPSLKFSFNLPLDAATKVISILAKREAGKTYTAGVIEEEFAKNSVPFVVVDPMGAHWGIKEKYPVVVFSAYAAFENSSLEHIPINEKLGAEVADTVVQSNISAVIDLSHFSKTNQRKFSASFAERIYEINSTPRHIFLEEADIFIPQTIYRETAHCFEAWDTIIRRGRQKGLGCTIISQRAAVVNKDDVSQSDLYLLMNMVSSQDLAAAESLLEPMLEKDDLKTVLHALPQLQSGETYVYSPKWIPSYSDKFVTIRKRETYHAGATPEFIPPNVKLISTPVKEVAERFTALMAKQEEEEDEVAILKKDLERRLTQIADLEKKLDQASNIQDLLRRAAQGGLDPSKLQEEAKAAYEKGFKEAEKQGAELIAKLNKQLEEVKVTWEHRLSTYQTFIGELTNQVINHPDFRAWIEPYIVTKVIPLVSTKTESAAPDDSDRTVRANLDAWINNPHTPEAARKILQTLKQSPTNARFPLSYFGYSVSGGAFRSALSFLKRNGLVTYDNASIKLAGE